MAIALLQTMIFLPEAQKLLSERFDLHLIPADPTEADRMLEGVGRDIRGIATNSTGPVREALIARLPALEVIACQSAGMEGIAVEFARRRGIAIFNASAVVAEDVADIALGLMLNVVRRIPWANQFLRGGGWAGGQGGLSAGRFPLANRLGGRRLGILGLGHVGHALARRGAALGMSVAYCGPHRKPDTSYPYFATAAELAGWCDVLAVTCAGGPATRHLVDAAILRELGPEGWLINVARGTVVDEAALIAAIVENRIAGAGLDVLEFEPEVPDALLRSDRVYLTPHLGSSTREAKAMMGSSMVDALCSWFSSDPAFS